MVLAAPNVVYTKFSFFSTLCSSSLSNEDSRLEKMPPADSDSFWFIFWVEVEKEEDACHRHLGWTAPETLFTRGEYEYPKSDFWLY